MLIIVLGKMDSSNHSSNERDCPTTISNNVNLTFDMQTNNITSVPDGRNVTANNEEDAIKFQQGINKPSKLRDDRNGKLQDRLSR